MFFYFVAISITWQKNCIYNVAIVTNMNCNLMFGAPLIFFNWCISVKWNGPPSPSKTFETV